MGFFQSRIEGRRGDRGKLTIAIGRGGGRQSHTER